MSILLLSIRSGAWDCISYMSQVMPTVLAWQSQSKYQGLTQENLQIPTAKSLQSCPTLCDPIDGSPPGSAVPGILQAITLEWVAISFSSAWKWKVKVKSLSHFRLFATPWTAAYQAPAPMGFSRQEYWSGLPLPSPTNTNKGMKSSVLLRGFFGVLKYSLWWFIRTFLIRIFNILWMLQFKIQKTQKQKRGHHSRFHAS